LVAPTFFFVCVVPWRLGVHSQVGFSFSSMILVCFDDEFPPMFQELCVVLYLSTTTFPSVGVFWPSFHLKIDRLLDLTGRQSFTGASLPDAVYVPFCQTSGTDAHFPFGLFEISMLHPLAFVFSLLFFHFEACPPPIPPHLRDRFASPFPPSVAPLGLIPIPL